MRRCAMVRARGPGGRRPDVDLRDAARSRAPRRPEPTPARLAARRRRRPPVSRLSYSSLGEYERCGYRFYAERVLGCRRSEPPGPRRRGGAARVAARTHAAAERGMLVHALLERLDFRRPVPPSRTRSSPPLRAPRRAAERGRGARRADRGVRRQRAVRAARPRDGRRAARSGSRSCSRRRAHHRGVRRARARARRAGCWSSTTRATGSTAPTRPRSCSGAYAHPAAGLRARRAARRRRGGRGRARASSRRPTSR